jgi:carboxylesterase type B
MVYLVGSFAFLLISLAQCAPVVDLGYVKYQGFQNATIGINYFRGIRYAQSPTGDLRWRAPVPIDHGDPYHGQLLPASQYGPSCFQSVPPWLPLPVSTYATYGTSEDCLLLDVLVPMNPVSSHLPVMVQIHAGGYIVGSSTTVPGDAIVNRSDGNLIYVQNAISPWHVRVSRWERS